MVVSLPGLTSQVAGSGSGSSGTFGAPKEVLECEVGPPCCRRTALAWWLLATEVAAADTPLNPGVVAGRAEETGRPASGTNEDEEEEEDKEGRGSTGVADVLAAVEVSDSLATSKEDTEVAANPRTMEGEGDEDGE